MSSFMSNHEADEFLERVDDITKQINDLLSGKTDIEELKKKELEIENKKKLEELTKDRLLREKAEEELKLKLNGVKGKGNGNNYNYFCVFCFREFSLETMNNCNICNRPVITREERHIYLKTKVEEYKEKKNKKKFRKTNFENWLKTEKLMDSRTFRNYQKWDLYESSTDEEEKNNPILPKDDPNFRALELDLENTRKKREQEFKSAESLKKLGNEKLKEGLFKEAIAFYSEALNTCKSMKSLYTNRAMAYLRINENHLAMQDCDKVIEYFEAFDEELISNLDLYIKALLRKSKALKNLRKYEDAREQLNKVISLKENNFEIVNIPNKIHEETFTNLVLKEIETVTRELEAEEIVFKGILNLNNLNSIKIETKEKIDNFLSIIDKFNTGKLDYKDDLFSPINNQIQDQNILKKNGKKGIESSKNCINEILNEIEKNQDVIIYLLSKNYLDLMISFIIRYNSKDRIEILENERYTGNIDELSTYLLEIALQIIDNNKRLQENENNIISMNSLSFFQKLLDIFLTKTEINKKFKIKTLNKLFLILERSSQVECVRKTFSLLPKISLCSEIMIMNYPFTKQDFELLEKTNLKEENSYVNINNNLNDKEQLIIIEIINKMNMYMNVLTFILNIMYSSNDFKMKILNNQVNLKIDLNINGFDEEKVKISIENYFFLILTKFLKVIDVKLDDKIDKGNKSNNSILIKSIYFSETLLSTLTNLSVLESYRKDFNKKQENINFIENLLKFVCDKKKFRTFDIFIDFYERLFGFLLNLNFEEKLTDLFLKNNLDECLRLIYGSIFKEIDFSKVKSSNSKILLIRCNSLLQKLVKSKDSLVYVDDFVFLNINILNMNIFFDQYKSNGDSSFISNIVKSFSIILNIVVKNTDIMKNNSTNKLLLNTIAKSKDHIWSCLHYENSKIKNKSIDNEILVNGMSGLISYYTLFNLNNDLKDSKIEIKNYEIDESKENIILIINFASNYLNLTRKNSAVLLAKMMKFSTKIDGLVRENHGMDVLMNIYNKIN